MQYLRIGIPLSQMTIQHIVCISGMLIQNYGVILDVVLIWNQSVSLDQVKKKEIKLTTSKSLHAFLFYTLTECEITVACDEVYSHVDCDGDGIIDHACYTTTNENHWLILSSEGCPNNWGTNDRSVSECPAAWPHKGNIHYEFIGF